MNWLRHWHEGLLLVALVPVSGCGGEGGVSPASWSGSAETVNGVLVVSNPSTPISHGATAWRVEENLSIGAAEGDPEYEFGTIHDLEIDEQGDIYVLDWQARRVSVYDPTGVFLTSFGRRGGGPGEFEDPSCLMWKADTLVVWDSHHLRLSYFDRAGRLQRDERPEIPAGFGWFEFSHAGRFWVQIGPSYQAPPAPERDGIGWLVAFTPGRQSVDTLLRWQDQSKVIVRTESFLSVLSKPHAPRVEWAVAPDGRLFVARGEVYEVEVYFPAGQRVATIRREYTRFPPSEAERDTALARLERLAERYGPHADRVRKAFEIADPKRATGDLVLSDEGYLWVQVVTDDDLALHTWDIFDRDGRYVSAVTLPARLSIERISGDLLYGRQLDEFDVPYVKRYVIRRPH